MPQQREPAVKRLSALLTAVAGALPLVLTPTSAQASTGTFLYTHAYTKLQVILSNPPRGTRVATTNNGCARNLIDRAVTLYPSPACRGSPGLSNEWCNWGGWGY